MLAHLLLPHTQGFTAPKLLSLKTPHSAHKLPARSLASITADNYEPSSKAKDLGWRFNAEGRWTATVEIGDNYGDIYAFDLGPSAHLINNISVFEPNMLTFSRATGHIIDWVSFVEVNKESFIVFHDGEQQTMFQIVEGDLFVDSIFKVQRTLADGSIETLTFTRLN